jgi:hypothetical protein
MGPCMADIFPGITNKIQRYTIYLFLWNALHVSGGTSALIRSSKTVYTGFGTCQIFIAAVKFDKYRICIYNFWDPDDGRRYRLSHVEHFTEINKLCNVASCWLYFEKTIPLLTSCHCNRPRAGCLSVSRHTDYILQFSLALANAVSVFVRLWFSDVKISPLGVWARHWHPPQIFTVYICDLCTEITNRFHDTDFESPK